MFSQPLADFKNETKMKTYLRARGPPGVSGPYAACVFCVFILCILCILKDRLCDQIEPALTSSWPAKDHLKPAHDQQPNQHT